MQTFADKILLFNKNLSFDEKLPQGIKVMNPFQENEEVLKLSEIFYQKFYADHLKRKAIFGINPGRLGGGATGIPFTDSKRLESVCKIPVKSIQTHEPSSVFIYDLIDRYGGVASFYQQFYISSLCPLGFVILNTKGNWVNANYYDSQVLFDAVKPFIIKSLKAQIEIGLETQKVFILGKKNAKFLKKILKEEPLFEEVVVFDHPRYIEQYKYKEKQKYLDHFIEQLIA